MNRIGVMGRYLVLAVLSASALPGVAEEPPEPLPELEIEEELETPPHMAESMRAAYQAIEREDFREAVRMFGRALQDNPRNKQARFGLGTVLIKMGRYPDAVKVLEPMTKEFPNDYFILNNLAWLYASASDVSMRDGARAIELAQKSLLIEPNDYHVWNTLSEAYYISGNYERALRAAYQALRLSRERDAPRDRQQEYEEQVLKCRRAHQAMSILD